MGRWLTFSVDTTGADGSASGIGTSVGSLHGYITAVRVVFHGEAPDTTTVTISESGGMGETILTLAAGNTDATYYPSSGVSDASGDAVEGATRPFYLTGTALQCSVANSDPLSGAVVVSAKIADAT